MPLPNPLPSAQADAAAGLMDSAEGQLHPHIVDQLIAERSLNLARNPVWPFVRPLLMRAFHYRKAVRMADDVRDLSGFAAMEYLSRLLQLELVVEGLENVPAEGPVILAPSHPTGIADGIAVFDAFKARRADMVFFANRDALRVAAGFRDLVIPVEWRAGEKSHAKGRDTLEMTARAFASKRMVVLFPSGRIAYWHEGKLTERPWQSSIVALARRYACPVVPVNIRARNSGLFYFLSRFSTDLRDITVFHELLNKTGRAYKITVGKPIAAAALEGDAAAVAARLQAHTVEALAADPQAEFLA
ncbi:1-acyl-sn-glycerol-3-phosphate acyltransferase [Arvimicrobium flavum]|uniref:1-acyl-sn-glycerol-3-phosphate acyltransferase n=1 Tax=Arvimicrobium flavum TaxID=3393320 RepID=UPI00237A4350|nr:1-acyl-sn-glycerol-3-phosphate acyltransferase [Mesorhizobium shangrilense]